MAVGVTISLSAPNWNPNVVHSPEPVGKVVKLQELRKWLASKGFQLRPDGLLLKEWVECYIHEKENEVAFVTFTFALPENCVEYIHEWENLCRDLVDDLGFNLNDDQTYDIVPLSEFKRLFANDKIWKILSESNNWPSIREEID